MPRAHTSYSYRDMYTVYTMSRKLQILNVVFWLWSLCYAAAPRGLSCILVLSWTVFLQNWNFLEIFFLNIFLTQKFYKFELEFDSLKITATQSTVKSSPK